MERAYLMIHCMIMLILNAFSGSHPVVDLEKSYCDRDDDRCDCEGIQKGR